MPATSDCPSPELPKLLKKEQAAEILAISERKLWTLTNCGEIAAVRFGRSVRYTPAALDAWIEAHEGKGPK